MSDLQTAYYIVALVFMGVMFGLIIALLVVALKIKAMVNKVHDKIDHKVDQARHLSDKASVLLNTIRYFVKP